ncbi:hypothetical protein SAMN05518683_101156 [Salibacterium halotolerans]|uniref:Uncharacterized protein n=2 Tax=Salibacterium halotolerans TaxID=1884432 RepID=A0A1I5L9P0_9BACI|nr:hypothetical protein SAMN05518683_101156 [Salibacterium halotolerans]
MLHHLITSKTRLRLLLKFFLNPGTEGYLRSITREFGDSTNAVRVELNRFVGQNMLTYRMEKNLKIYRANRGHEAYDDICELVQRYMNWCELARTLHSSDAANVFVKEEATDSHLFHYVVEDEQAGIQDDQVIYTNSGVIRVHRRTTEEILEMSETVKPFFYIGRVESKNSCAAVEK